MLLLSKHFLLSLFCFCCSLISSNLFFHASLPFLRRSRDLGCSTTRALWSWRDVRLVLRCLQYCPWLFHWGCLFILSYSSGVDLTLALGPAGGGFTIIRWLFQLNCTGVVGSTRALALGGGFTFLRWFQLDCAGVVDSTRALALGRGFTILCWLFQLDRADVIGSTRALALGGSFGSAFRSRWDVGVDWLSSVLSNFARSATVTGHVLRIG